MKFFRRDDETTDAADKDVANVALKLNRVNKDAMVSNRMICSRVQCPVTVARLTQVEWHWHCHCQWHCHWQGLVSTLSII